MDRLEMFSVFFVFLWTANMFAANETVSNVDNARTGKNNVDTKNYLGASTYFFYQRREYPRDCKEVADQCSSANINGSRLIKPDGYSQPFEVYCENGQGTGGWTVILRRHDGVVYFNRNWTEYKIGFGFLSTEFWLGNDKIAYLTNQKKYELRIDITNSYGVSSYATYNMFRISDEFDKYNLISLGEYSGNAGPSNTWCPNNTGYGNCACQKTCENPHDCLDICDNETICICLEDYYLKEGLCVSKEECECYAFEDVVIPEGQIYANSECTRLATCNNGQIIWDDHYGCGNNEICEIRQNVRQCYCNAGFMAEGADCVAITDCFDLYNAGNTENGVYNIKPTLWQGQAFEVYCNMSDGGGWTVFQRRVDDSVDFYRNWTSYKEGFGSPDDGLWLGNEKLYFLTNQKRYTLRIDFVNKFGSPYYAKFNFFRIGDAESKYRLLRVGAYSGNADSRSNPNGRALRAHLNQPFSTYDQDNDPDSRNCAVELLGAWWYKTCQASDLNGDYNAPENDYKSIYWLDLPGSRYNIKFTEMKLRPF